MTNQEAVKWLKRIRMNYPSRNVEHVESDVALHMAIKALEREPVLDKIRADIENSEIVYDKSPNYKDERTDEEKANDSWRMCKALVLSTIDKYKAESEDKE